MGGKQAGVVQPLELSDPGPPDRQLLVPSTRRPLSTLFFSVCCFAEVYATSSREAQSQGIKKE